MKKFILMFLLASMIFTPSVKADEGMWLLPFIGKNIKDMKKQGFKLSAEDIYSINKNSLKDAIVIFGNGCTGEIVSDKGLILTNHHCGFPSIQQHSTVEHDYLKDGFWAMSMEEEIPTPGLEVRFVRSIRDVTAEVLQGADDKMSEQQRAQLVTKNSKAIVDAETAKNPYLEVQLKDFFGGNQYLLFTYEVFNDIRMVGAPPSSIGKFGGETDNWMWPRHTGDFSMFRVYSTADGKPAGYSKTNVPYTPKRSLAISLKGFKPGDFAMIMGFPGSTQRYMSSYEIDKTLQQDNPNRIKIRGIRQEILKEDMAASDKVRIQYASKYAQSSNYWKNSIGASRGLEKLNVKAQKQEIEARFTEWANATPERAAKYGNALKMKEDAVKGMRPVENNMQIFNEAIFSSVEALAMSMGANSLMQVKTVTPAMAAKFAEMSEEMYKDYNESTDRKVAKRMFKLVTEMLPTSDLPSIYTTEIETKFGGDIDKYVDYIYDNSVFASKASFDKYLADPNPDKLKTDPAFVAVKSVREKAMVGNAVLGKYRTMFKEGHRLFVDGYTQMETAKQHYPDANFTLRMTYGQVLPYDPTDGVTYKYYTTLKGVMDKEDLNNPTEFTVHPKLKELYKAKDYGQYGDNGVMPVAFLSNNDITGGNSGSPVLNGKGELIGLAFDGNWEAMSGDIAFEPELQRTISVDIRYVLFVVDKFAGATRLIDEMKIVK